jgi:hypothetical protein
MSSGAQTMPGDPERIGPMNVDETFVDTQGRTGSLRKDVFNQGPALIGFIFTHCQKTCPLLAGRLDALTDALAAIPERERLASSLSPWIRTAIRPPTILPVMTVPAGRVSKWTEEGCPDLFGRWLAPELFVSQRKLLKSGAAGLLVQRIR